MCFLKHDVMLKTCLHKPCLNPGYLWCYSLYEMAHSTYLSYAVTQLHPRRYTQLMCTTRFASSVATTRVNITTTLTVFHVYAVCTFKNPVFVRWLAGGTPVRNNEFMYVASKSTLHSTQFIHSCNLAVADVFCRSSVHFHPINPKPCK